MIFYFLAIYNVNAMYNNVGSMHLVNWLQLYGSNRKKQSNKKQKSLLVIIMKGRNIDEEEQKVFSKSFG